MSRTTFNDQADRVLRLPADRIVDPIRARDYAALVSLPSHLLHSGSSEIRNWIAVTAAATDLHLDWISYVPAYRSRAMTGVGLCFAHWS